jgi:hypothetical protein
MSGYDPFAPQPTYGPTEPGETARDPFAPPLPLLPRTPRSANGNISPTITLEIEYDTNGRIRDIETFSLVDDVQQLADPWTCAIPNVDGERDYLLDYRWYPVTLYVSDPRVEEGREILWLKGVITDIEQTAAEDKGTVITLSGYDRGWYLGSGAPIWRNLQGISMGRLFQLLIRPENNWGITAATSSYLNNRLRQGRIDAEVAQVQKKLTEQKQAQEVVLAVAQEAARSAGQPVPTRAEMALELTPPFFSKPPVIQTEPGEDCGSLMIRYARAQKRLIGMSADGVLQYFQPDYQQKPSYIFHNHRPKDTRRDRNNVGEQWRYQQSGEMANVVECVTTRLLKDGTGLANEANPNEGKDVGKYVNLGTAGPPKAPPLRRVSFNDGTKWNLDQANDRALWRWQQLLYASKTLTYPVQGLSQCGPDGVWRLYCAGSMAEVYDSWNRVERSMFVSRVQFAQGRGGTSSVITCKLPNLLGA